MHAQTRQLDDLAAQLAAAASGGTSCRVVVVAATPDHIPKNLAQFPQVHTGGTATAVAAWAALGVGSEERPPWTVVIALEWLVVSAVGFWESPRIGIITLQGIVAAVSRMNASNPILAGMQTFDSTVRAHKGDGFAAIEPQSWLPACSIDAPLVASRGFLRALQHRGREPSIFDKMQGQAEGAHGLANRERCAALGNATFAFATCLYEEFGMQCISLTAATVGIDLAPTNEWAIWQRHVQWNCSLEIPTGEVSVPPNRDLDTQTVTAVCQQPLRQVPAVDDVRAKMAFSPDDTGKHYTEKLAPEEGPSSAVPSDGASLAVSNLRTSSWVLHRDTSSTPDPVRVVYAAGEVRDVVLVVGAGAQVKPQPVELFIRSLRATGCRAEVVFFIDARCADAFIPMATAYGGVRVIAFDAEVLGKAYHSSKPVVIYRFVLYEHFLRTQSGAGVYRRCLHVDLFDTYFQRDPFAAVDLRGGLAVFAENPFVELGVCNYHRFWFQQCRERFLLHRVYTVPRVCMGVVLGEYQPFLDFLRLTLFRMLKYCNDQGVLNMLVWSGQYAEIMPVTVYTARRGPVFHANTEWSFSYVMPPYVLAAPSYSCLGSTCISGNSEVQTAASSADHALLLSL